MDYSDLYSKQPLQKVWFPPLTYPSNSLDAMVFFAGAEGVPGHDELAREISEAAQDFAHAHWRWQDMQSFMFRLLLEYRRLLAEDRDAMSYGGRMVWAPAS